MASAIRFLIDEVSHSKIDSEKASSLRGGSYPVVCPVSFALRLLSIGPIGGLYSIRFSFMAVAARQALWMDGRYDFLSAPIQSNPANIPST